MNKYTQMVIEDKLLDDYFQSMKSHDFAYDFTEDMNVWKKWNNNEKRIRELIHAIVTVVRYPADDLLSESLKQMPTEFMDGSRLVEVTIRKWFVDYL